MKKFLFILSCVLWALNITAQTVVNADGSIKFRANVAILVESRNFSFIDGQYQKLVDDEANQQLKTAIRALCMQKFQNTCIAVVNRDDEAYKQVTEALKENKLEDYINGFSVQAKGQGADYLFIVDIVNYSEDNVTFQMMVSTRLVDVAHNYGYHSFYKSSPYLLKNVENANKAAKEMVTQLSKSLDNMLLTVFPEQYGIYKANGKSLLLYALQPNGRILPTDNFYAFRHGKVTNWLYSNENLETLDYLTTGQFAGSSNGYLEINVDKKLRDNEKDIILFKGCEEPRFQRGMSITFFGLDFDYDNYDGFIKSRINNAMYSAISKHKGLLLIEHDHLPDLKKERELQKTEDFIKGHTVEQMKAHGAKFMFYINNYNRNGMQVSFDLSVISVANNQIIRTVNVQTSIDNIENELYKQICERVSFPCIIEKQDNDEVVLTSVLTLTSGDDCIISANKTIKNPLTGETTYSRFDLCKLKFEEYHANKSIMSIDEVLDKEGMKDIEKYSSEGGLMLSIDGSKIKSNNDTESSLQKQVKKEKKKSGFMNALKKLGQSVKFETGK